MSAWATGAFQSNEPIETHSANLQALGQMKFINDFLELTYEEYAEAMQDADG
jgi:hypothetical protein